MPTPLPTPYDITPIPGFPFVPGLLLWLLVLIGALLLLFAVARPRKASVKGKIGAARQETLSHLSALTINKAGTPQELLAEASLTIRRFLSALFDLDIRSATPQEILAIAPNRQSCAALITKTAEVEAARFSPHTTPDQAASLVKELTHRLQTLPDDALNLEPERRR